MVNEKKGAPGGTPCTQHKYTPVLRTLQEGSHTYCILKHLIEHGSITQKEAINEYECYRLSARIHDLRAKGVDIGTLEVRNKKHGTHARYFLLRELELEF